MESNRRPKKQSPYQIQIKRWNEMRELSTTNRTVFATQRTGGVSSSDLTRWRKSPPSFPRRPSRLIRFRTLPSLHLRRRLKNTAGRHPSAAAPAAPAGKERHSREENRGGMRISERSIRTVDHRRIQQAQVEPAARMLETIEEISVYVHRFHNLDLFQQGCG
ncbi:hypothetical protein ACLOJK_030241 [Asimina triloba]